MHIPHFQMMFVCIIYVDMDNDDINILSNHIQ